MEDAISDETDLRRALDRIKFVNTVLNWKWQFHFREFGAMSGDGKTGWLLWVSFERPDTLTGEIGRGRGRDEVVWRGATVSSVVKTAWVLVKMNVEHELMEGFQVDGVRIFNPHRTVEQLKMPG
jgi:hypothetical protein